MMIDKTNNRKEKKTWERVSEEHREAFEQDIEELVEKGKRVATSALIIGGGFAISYLLVKKLAGGNKVKKTKKIKKMKGSGHSNTGHAAVSEVVIEKKPSVLSTVGNVVLTEIAVFLLAIAKEKLIEYIEKQRDNEHPERTE